MRLHHLIAVTVIAFCAGLPAVASAQPELVVRMGQLTINSNEFPVNTAGTLHQNIIPGETRTMNFLLENRGDQNLTIDPVAAIDGPGASPYQVEFGPDTLIEPGQGAFLIVTYAPEAPGDHVAWVRLTTNDPDEGLFSISLRGECIPVRIGPAPVDLSIYSVLATTKCNAKKGFCTAKGKVRVLNLATAPSSGYDWRVSPSPDGLYSPNAPFLFSGFGKKMKAYKGFPAAFPKQNLKLKINTPPPGVDSFVLLLVPAEGDLDYSDNSIHIQIPQF